MKSAAECEQQTAPTRASAGFWKLSLRHLPKKKKREKIPFANLLFSVHPQKVVSQGEAVTRVASKLREPPRGPFHLWPPRRKHEGETHRVKYFVLRRRVYLHIGFLRIRLVLLGAR